MPVTATFSRSGVAYKQDGSQVASGIPRYEAGRSGQAIMVEEGTTNLVSNSDSLTGWTLIGATVTLNAASGRYGTLIADRLYENSGNSNHGAQSPAITVTANNTHTISIDVQYSGRWMLLIGWTDAAGNNGVSTLFNVALGTVISSTTYGTGVLSGTATIVRVNADIWRCVITGNIGGSVTSGHVLLLLGDGGSTFYPGDISEPGVVISAVQVEAKSYATGFIPTISGAVTRNNEVVELPQSVWKKEPPWTIGCWFYYQTQSHDGDGRRIISGTETGGFNISISSATNLSYISASVHTGGSYQVVKSLLSNLVQGWNYVAFSVSSTSIKLYINGVLKDQVNGTFTTIQWPSVGALKCFVGSENVGGAATLNFFNNLIDDLRFYNRALTDAEVMLCYKGVV